MSINIREKRMHHIEIFEKPALLTDWLIMRDTVPPGWYCYDLRGSAHNPAKAVTLEDQVTINHAGTVLSPKPLKNPGAAVRQIDGQLFLLGELLSLEDFCKVHDLEYPQDTRKYLLRPASPDEAGLFFSSDEATDRELACVGHLRLDFGHQGKEFWSTWWTHNNDELNIPAFKAEFDEMVNELRAQGPLKDLASMTDYCVVHPEGRLDGENRSFGFISESERYRYCLRCILRPGDYNGYLYIYDKHQQELNMAEKKQFGLTEIGKQKLRDAADPGRPHTYNWFVLENFGTPQEQIKGHASLDDAIGHYAAIDGGHKRLGVTKDDIATVDLVVSMEGEQWYTDDEQHSESFREDPVVTEAVQKLRRELPPTPVPGMTMGGISQ